jgi:NAD(P)-dependent dehydrogenase (short-subunit alcohol dehydrogenase family)
VAQSAQLIDQCIALADEPVVALINNASVFESDDAMTADNDSWDKHLEVNLHAPFLLSQALAKSLDGIVAGNIINIIDQRVLKLNPQYLSYTLSKSGLWTLTRTLAQSLAPTIRVNAIGPGPTLASIHQNDDDFQRETTSVLLGRGPDPKEIASTIAYILDTPSLTGQIIALDGGQHLAWQTPDIDLTD